MEKSNIEEVLQKDGVIVWPNVGHSMEPLIRQGRDLMVIGKRPEGRMKKYDAVLYRSGGSLILHRILRVRENDYVICGDNCVKKEYGITDEMIIGVLQSLVRNGKPVALKGPKYWLYVHLRCDFFHIRVGLIRMRNVFRRVVRKVKSVSGRK